MRSTIALIILLVLVGCNPSAQVTSGSSSNKAINADAPYIWGDQTFPKIIKVSSSFSPNEKTAMTEMGAAWQTSLSKDFFDFEDTDNIYDLDDPDPVMGIYKATTWPSDVSEDALAITQLFGRRYNTGDEDEYVSIVHADIIMNYAPSRHGRIFSFDAGAAGAAVTNFDLRSVILHEMGHFLGLQHIPKYVDRPASEIAVNETNYKASSVMYPSISAGTKKRVPQSKDRNTLAYKYNVAGAGSFSTTGEEVVYQPRESDPGESTKIIIELRKNGDCIHHENGVVVRRHQIELKNKL